MNRIILSITGLAALAACSQQTNFVGEPRTNDLAVHVTAANVGGPIRPILILDAGAPRAFGPDRRHDERHVREPARVHIDGKVFEGWVLDVYENGRQAFVFLDDDHGYDELRSVVGRTGTIDVYAPET